MRTSSFELTPLLTALHLVVACQTRTPLPRDSSHDADAGDSVGDASAETGGGDAGPTRGSDSTDVGAVPDSGSDNPSSGPSTPDAGGVDGGVADPDVRYEMNTWEDFAALATPEGEVKFLLPTAPTAAHGCWFQDTVRYPYHLQFLRTLPEFEDLSAERYEDLVLARAERTFHAGVLRLFSNATHPTTGNAGILTYTVYTASTPSELLTPSELGEIARHLEHCLGPLAAYLAYLPEGALALSAAQQHSDELASLGVPWVEPSQLQNSVEAAIYSAGEAYGYVRHITDGDSPEVGHRDVVVAEAAPGELGIVAALVTRQVQSSVSHLNLRLREKRIPNASAPELFASGLFASLEGTLVHVQASETGISITPARLSDARAFWQTQAPELPAPEFSLDVTEPSQLEQLVHEDVLAFGTKAANLGELRRALPPANVPHGLALPFAAYVNHVEHSGLRTTIESAVAAASSSSPSVASELLSDLRKQLKQAPLDRDWESRLLEALSETFGTEALTTRLRFRSSTNVEDLPGLSGAGLYDSASGCYADDLDADEAGPSHCLTDDQKAHYEAELSRLRAKLQASPEMTELNALIADAEEELTEENSARKALRKVWASLWNDRAFQDREYYGIPHDRVFMGVVVHPAMVGERIESVIVTNLEPEANTPLYRVESQAGEVGVVEPSESDAISEQLEFRRAPDDTPASISLLRQSSFSTNGSSLWSDDNLATLATLTFAVQDHFAEHVYPDLTPLQLDLEVDVASDGTIVLKQARPYVSGGW